MLDDESLNRYIEIAKRMSEKGTYPWWDNLEKILSELKDTRKAIKKIPDDMDYPNAEEFRNAFNYWYNENIYPLLKETNKQKE